LFEQGRGEEEKVDFGVLTGNLMEVRQRASAEGRGVRRALPYGGKNNQTTKKKRGLRIKGKLGDVRWFDKGCGGGGGGERMTTGGEGFEGEGKRENRWRVPGPSLMATIHRKVKKRIVASWNVLQKNHESGGSMGGQWFGVGRLSDACVRGGGSWREEKPAIS